MTLEAADNDTYDVSPRAEAKAVLRSGLAFLRIGLRQVISALWTLLVGEWPGHTHS